MEHGEGCGPSRISSTRSLPRVLRPDRRARPASRTTRACSATRSHDEPDGHGIPPEALGAAPGKVVFLTLTTRFLHGLPRFRDPGAKGVSDAYAARRA
jgi:hypothetical protein